MTRIVWPYSEFLPPTSTANTDATIEHEVAAVADAQATNNVDDNNNYTVANGTSSSILKLSCPTTVCIATKTDDYYFCFQRCFVLDFASLITPSVPVFDDSDGSTSFYVLKQQL